MRLAWVAATLSALTLLTSVTSSPIQLEIEIRKAGGSGSGPGPGLHGDSLEMNAIEEKINANLPFWNIFGPFHGTLPAQGLVTRLKTRQKAHGLHHQ